MMGVPQKEHSKGQTFNSKCKKCPAGTLSIWHALYRGFLCLCQACFKSHGCVCLSTAQQYEEYFRVVSRQTAGNGVCMVSSMFNEVKFSKLQGVVFLTWSCCTLVTCILLWWQMLSHFIASSVKNGELLEKTIIIYTLHIIQKYI